MRTKSDPPHSIDPDDRENNTSENPHFDDLLKARLHRRHLLRGGVGAMAAATTRPTGACCS